MNSKIDFDRLFQRKVLCRNGCKAFLYFRQRWFFALGVYLTLNPTSPIVPTTDPECGMFQKREHKRCFAYEAHIACDKNGYVLEAVITPGNIHDSVAFDDVYDNVKGGIPGGLTSMMNITTA